MVKVKIEAKIAYIDIKFFLSEKVEQKFGYVVNVFYLCTWRFIDDTETTQFLFSL